MIKEALGLNGAASPAKFWSPSGARVRSFVSTRVHAREILAAIRRLGDIKNSSFAGLGEVFIGPGAIVNVGNDGGTGLASASLKLGRYCLL